MGKPRVLSHKPETAFPFLFLCFYILLVVGVLSRLELR